MKVFFGLLLIVNIAFAVFQWLLPYEQLFADRPKIAAAEELQLLTDANAQVVSEAEVVAEVEAETDAIAAAVARIEKEVKAAGLASLDTGDDSDSEKHANLVSEDDSDKRMCYTVGPIKDKARAIEISGRYSGKAADTSLKSNLEKEYLGVMVYIGGHATRDAAVNTANQLAAKGITDHIIVDSSVQANILSLGVFGLKRNADRLRSRVEKMEFKVETEPRYRERTIYWLYAEQSSESELLQLLEQTDKSSGISQIPTQCLPG